ncbi:alpha/beta hydrolase [Nocardia sp. NPDC127606]|uniref:alpha/beta hydrolase n=1 Tax=Nocardia sp. NPDC127606 TaxID=3345406 RepID=UPI00362BD21D
MTKALTVAQVLSWRPESLTALANEWNRQATELRTEMDEQWRAVDSSRESWKGAAGEAMRTRFETVRTQSMVVLTALDKGKTTATFSASNYQVAKTLVANAKTNAEAAPKNFEVKPDGTCEITEITKRAVYSAVGGDADRYSTAIAALTTDADACTGVLKRALANAADVDTVATNAIKAAFTGLPDDAKFENSSTPKATVSVPQPPKGGTAEENRKYWDSLTPEQQTEAVKTIPSAIGSLDGLPAAARDTANRNYLATETVRLEREYQSLVAQAAAKPESFTTGQKLEEARNRLADVKAVTKTLDGGTEQQPRKLLMLDTTSGDQVRAAVAVGDPDTADHISVTTPGLTSNVRESLGSMVSEAGALQDQAQSQLIGAGEPGSKVSTIAWVGYDPPQQDSTYPEVALQNRAQEAAVPLSNFYDGLNEANQNTDPHITALGHSYGSLATSLALQEKAGVVDDVVFYGSPGLGGDWQLANGPSLANVTGLNDAVESAQDLGVKPGHVYEMTERGEKVGNLNTFGRSPNQMPWVTHLSTEEININGTTYTGAEGHSEYGRVDGDTKQLHRSGYNLAAVVAGLPQNAISPNGGGR